MFLRTFVTIQKQQKKQMYRILHVNFIPDRQYNVMFYTDTLMIR